MHSSLGVNSSIRLNKGLPTRPLLANQYWIAAIDGSFSGMSLPIINSEI
jgi:hypothetical protein